MARIQLRRDTAANWASANPVLADGELGVETDTGVVKHGDGSTAYNSLNPILSGTYATPVRAGQIGRTSAGKITPAARRKVYVPAPSSLSATLTQATVNPIWLSDDGATLYGYSGLTLYKSTDDGATWASVHAFPATVQGCRTLANGELIVSVWDGTNPGELWVSSAGAWRQVLTTSVGTAVFDGHWGISASRTGGRVMAGEYGTKISGGAASAPRYAYLSSDYGQTWTTVFDLGDVNDGHVHGVGVDDYRGWLWVVTGDSVNRSMRFSTDAGVTWKVISQGLGTPQPVGVLPLPECVLFGTDSTPNGILRVWMDGNDDPASMEVDTAIVVEDQTSLATLLGQPFRRGEDQPVIIPFVRSTNGPARLLVSRDGVDFHEVWTDTLSYSSGGLETCLGPTVSGKLVGLLSDARYGAGTSSLFTAAAPAFLSRTGRGVSMEVSTYGLGSGTAGIAQTTTAASGPAGLDIRAKVDHPSWAPAGNQAIIGRDSGIAPNQEYELVLQPDGTLVLYWWDSGNVVQGQPSTASLTSVGAVASRPMTVRVTMQPSNGSNVWEVKYYYSTDDGATWTQLGTTRNGVAPSSVATTTATLILGAVSSGAAWPGKAWWGEVRDFAGNIIARIDLTDSQWDLGAYEPTDGVSYEPTFTDERGNVWKLGSGARIRGALQVPSVSSYLDPITLPAAGSVTAADVRQALIDLGLAQ